ncbi:hypothetical protein HDU97_000423 [Phlyctochytrium planicorne]|nr:hypothetical protein HDU97_000423 [Phlyctochytrium planicorne]
MGGGPLGGSSQGSAGVDGVGEGEESAAREETNQQEGEPNRPNPANPLNPDGPPLYNMAEMLQQILMGIGIPSADARSLFNMVGNPGDYVFGQQGLDSIITQLMEQNSIRNAPPPASETAISNLPRVNVKGSELGEHPECSVCQDEFSNDGEVAVKLSCSHHFHPPCIENWLKMNEKLAMEFQEQPSALSTSSPSTSSNPNASKACSTTFNWRITNFKLKIDKDKFKSEDNPSLISPRFGLPGRGVELALEDFEERLESTDMPLMVFG